METQTQILTLADCQYLQAISKGMACAAAMSEKFIEAWTDKPADQWLRPKDILEAIGQQGRRLTGPDLSVLIREPLACGLIERDPNSPLYRASDSFRAIETVWKEWTVNLAGTAFGDFDMKGMSQLYDKLGQPYTWAILCVLQNGPKNVGEVVSEVNALCSGLPGSRFIQQPEITARLRYLEALDFIHNKPQGKFRYYQVKGQERFDQTIGTILEVYGKHPAFQYFGSTIAQ